jgi:hypothetical protein
VRAREPWLLLLLRREAWSRRHVHLLQLHLKLPWRPRRHRQAWRCCARRHKLRRHGSARRRCEHWPSIDWCTVDQHYRAWAWSEASRWERRKWLLHRRWSTMRRLLPWYKEATRWPRRWSSSCVALHAVRLLLERRAAAAGALLSGLVTLQKSSLLLPQRLHGEIEGTLLLKHRAAIPDPVLCPSLHSHTA